jgi:hypothetical protein
MTSTMDWQGRELKLRICFSPRFLMFATDTTLTVDGRLVARKGGLGITETAKGSFSHNGKRIWSELQVRGNPLVFTRIPYELRFNGLQVSKGRLRLERLGAAAIVWLTLAGLLLLGAFVL